MCWYDHGRFFWFIFSFHFFSYVLLIELCVCVLFWTFYSVHQHYYSGGIYRVRRCRCRDPNDRPLIEIIFCFFLSFLVLLSFDKYCLHLFNKSPIHKWRLAFANYHHNWEYTGMLPNSAPVNHHCFNTTQLTSVQLTSGAHNIRSVDSWLPELTKGPPCN